MAVKLGAAIWDHLRENNPQLRAGSRRAESEPLVADRSGGVGALGKMFRPSANYSVELREKNRPGLPTVVAALSSGGK